MNLRKEKETIGLISIITRRMKSLCLRILTMMIISIYQNLMKNMNFHKEFLKRRKMRKETLIFKQNFYFNSS